MQKITFFRVFKFEFGFGLGINPLCNLNLDLTFWPACRRRAAHLRRSLAVGQSYNSLACARSKLQNESTLKWFLKIKFPYNKNFTGRILEGAVLCWAGKIVRTPSDNWNECFGYWVFALITNRLLWRIITRVLFVFRAVLFRLRRTRQCCLHAKDVPRIPGVVRVIELYFVSIERMYYEECVHLTVLIYWIDLM